LAEQGSPPRRPARQPDLGRRGYDRQPGPDHAAPAAEHAPVSEWDGGPGWEPRSARSERAQRSERAGRRDDAARAERPRRDGRADRGERRHGWDERNAFDSDTDADLPPWAGPAVYAARPGGTLLRPPSPDQEQRGADYADPWEGDERPEWPEEAPADGPDGAGGGPQRAEGRRAGRRAAAARLRKWRRRVLRWSGVAIAACVIAGVVVVLTTHHGHTNLPYVTALQPGEFKSVPDACTATSPALLNQYLPPPRRTMVQSLASSTDSACTFTVDSKPDFLVLSVAAQSYQPFAAATGNGSASQNALDNFAAARLALAKPARKSPLPPASISTLAGTGQHAFVAVQLEHAGKIATDAVTVDILQRNDVISVSMSAQESGGYGPVPVTTLEADAQAVARAVLQKALAQPTA
jgi:hypothetical protein